MVLASVGGAGGMAGQRLQHLLQHLHLCRLRMIAAVQATVAHQALHQAVQADTAHTVALAAMVAASARYVMVKVFKTTLIQLLVPNVLYVMATADAPLVVVQAKNTELNDSIKRRYDWFSILIPHFI